MNVEVEYPDSLHRFTEAIGPAGRKNLFAVAANALRILILDHVMNLASVRHSSIERLVESSRATRTGHYSKGARAISFAATSEEGVVTIPIAGFSRAFRDIEIRPRYARCLTIPNAGPAYGHRAFELQAMGWELFRKRRKDDRDDLGDGILYGRRDNEVLPMYLLRMRVMQKQDPTLLPSRAAQTTAVTRAMISEIRRITFKGSA